MRLLHFGALRISDFPIRDVGHWQMTVIAACPGSDVVLPTSRLFCFCPTASRVDSHYYHHAVYCPTIPLSHSCLVMPTAPEVTSLSLNRVKPSVLAGGQADLWVFPHQPQQQAALLASLPLFPFSRPTDPTCL